ncbi:MAG: hypothetical protein J3K34DRAFT_240468 [Monoraphidium minutum]|nr:MAG: hypothetical protein J3K34DRAFT_240468 [Monoraphidium minutum]
MGARPALRGPRPDSLAACGGAHVNRTRRRFFAPALRAAPAGARAALGARSAGARPSAPRARRRLSGSSVIYCCGVSVAARPPQGRLSVPEESPEGNFKGGACHPIHLGAKGLLTPSVTQPAASLPAGPARRRARGRRPAACRGRGGAASFLIQCSK